MFTEFVYSSGCIKRTDYSLDNPLSNDLMGRIRLGFPEYFSEKLNIAPDSIVGESQPYRRPYNNNTISYYQFRKPSVRVLEQHGCRDRYEESTLCEWYGFKFDTEQMSVSLKVVLRPKAKEFFSNHPELPPCRIVYYGRIYKPDAGASTLIDCFFTTSEDIMRDWCNHVNLDFPLPDNFVSPAGEGTSPWCYCVVWDEESGQIECVKAYLRKEHGKH